LRIRRSTTEYHTKYFNVLEIND